MSLYKNRGWWKNFDCIYEFSAKSYVRNTINLSCAKIMFPSVIDQSVVFTSGFWILRRVMTVVTSEVSGMRTSTLGLFVRSLESTTVSCALSHNSPSPLIVHINQKAHLHRWSKILPVQIWSTKTVVVSPPRGSHPQQSKVLPESCRPESDPIWHQDGVYE